MKKKRTGTKYRNVRFIVVLFLALLIAGLLSLVNILRPNTLKIASEEPKKSLQISFFKLHDTSTPVPTPLIPACNHDNGIAIANSGEQFNPSSCTCPAYSWVMECMGRKCTDVKSGMGVTSGVPFPGPGPCDIGYQGQNQQAFDNYCASQSMAPTDGIYCIGKPVIYLYPNKDMLVNVTVKTVGEIVVSDPQIENGNTWKQVLAHPGGMLEYKGNTYRELFYESETTTLTAPQKGIVIKSSELISKLKEHITLLGLTRRDEQDEFLDWWVPRLQALNSPYIFFSVLEQNEKHRLDQVAISPKPDTFIEFIAYFRPMEKLERVEELQITPAPKRVGFTAVEWGGVIDKEL